MSADKFKALVHFVVNECKDPTRLGATRLNKILWYADSLMFRQTGNSITGARYVRRPKGPVPFHVLVALRQLRDEGAISIREPLHPYEPREFVALRAPNMSLFSEMEEALVRDLVGHICSTYTANGISDLTHNDVWKAAKDGEEIPFTATLVAEGGNYDDRVLSWADKEFDRVIERARAA